MSDYTKPLEFLESIFMVCLIFLPLGIWKFIEILIWMYNLNWKALFS